MKTTTAFQFRPALMIAALAFSLSLAGCSKDEVATPAATTDAALKSSSPDELLAANAGICKDTLPVTPLNEEEINILIHMRAEELVARDVYQYFSGLYTSPVFRNITKSENVHAEAVKTLMTRYSVTDPEATHVAGTFADPEFQTLYNTLTSSGSQSLLAAMTVGATIEDLDIFDLGNYIPMVMHPDIRQVFTNLQNASKNHMRAFYANIIALGGTYTPQYITQAQFEAIIQP